MKNCGPAFPAPFWDGQSMKMLGTGMTLRDYFAAAALNRLLAWDFTGPPESKSGFAHYSEQAALTAYQLADAMLAERDK